MSTKTTKSKLVSQEVLEHFPLPQSSSSVVKAAAGRGNNLHEVQFADGSVSLASIPTKFRKHIWIKRGDFLLVEPIDEGEKVTSEISHVLYKDQIRHIHQQGLWPAAFERDISTVVKPQRSMIPDDMLPPGSSDEEEDSGCDRPENCNPNRVAIPSHYDSESSEDDDVRMAEEIKEPRNV